MASNLADRLVSAIESRKDGGRVTWWRWPLIIFLVLVAAALFTWWIGRNGRELAKLRHEKKKRKVLLDQSVTDANIDVEFGKVDERQKVIDSIDSDIEGIDARIRNVEERIDREKDAISRIRSWDDAGSLPSG